ncbi:hypothetical protein KW797_01875 [Candidatus Parcubacteria bacterium]|nr:hypothetical protein [Candidatus Parcubacteria bacterium]
MLRFEKRSKQWQWDHLPEETHTLGLSESFATIDCGEGEFVRQRSRYDTREFEKDGPEETTITLRDADLHVRREKWDGRATPVVAGAGDVVLSAGFDARADFIKVIKAL